MIINLYPSCVTLSNTSLVITGSFSKGVPQSTFAFNLSNSYNPLLVINQHNKEAINEYLSLHLNLTLLNNIVIKHFEVVSLANQTEGINGPLGRVVLVETNGISVI